jgi:flavin reductase (DIM6/NTAB) family NADH-FMN oxidoreductase RutF
MRRGLRAAPFLLSGGKEKTAGPAKRNITEPHIWNRQEGKHMEFAGDKSVITPEAVFIIGTYDENGMPNAMNAAWAMQSDMNEITIMLSKHKTTENFEKTGAFTVAFGTADTVLISDYFGVETGKKVNKIEKAGCHVHKSAHVNAPIIEEYPLTLECKVKSWDPATGYVIGEIVASQADERILTDGKVDLGKLMPIIFDPSFNAYRVVGDIVGKAFKDGLQQK